MEGTKIGKLEISYNGILVSWPTSADRSSNMLRV